MSDLYKLLEEMRLRPTDTSKQASDPEAEVSSSSALEGGLSPARQSPPQEWNALIQRVKAAGQQSRDVQVQAREHEARIGQLLEEVREDINSANERARLAEAKARDVQAHAEALILATEERAKAAEARAQAADDRAQHAEEWLVRVQETILSEFTDLTVQAAA